MPAFRGAARRHRADIWQWPSDGVDAPGPNPESRDGPTVDTTRLLLFARPFGLRIVLRVANDAIRMCAMRVEERIADERVPWKFGAGEHAAAERA